MENLCFRAHLRTTSSESISDHLVCWKPKYSRQMYILNSCRCEIQLLGQCRYQTCAILIFRSRDQFAHQIYAVLKLIQCGMSMSNLRTADICLRGRCAYQIYVVSNSSFILITCASVHNAHQKAPKYVLCIKSYCVSKQYYLFYQLLHNGSTISEKDVK